MSRVMSLFGILLAGVGVSAWKAPHVRLATQLAFGDLDGSPIPVVDSVPAQFLEKTVPVRCGDLVFEVPVRAGIEPVLSGEPSGVNLELDGLKCQVMPPRHQQDDEWELLDLLSWEGTFGEDRMAKMAGVCRASGRDLSFWMGRADVQRLQERLEVRPLYCLCAERVEVIRSQTLSGLLLIWTYQGKLRMTFEYLSPDGRIGGRAFLLADTGSDQVMRAARALLSTFRLQPTSALTFCPLLRVERPSSG